MGVFDKGVVFLFYMRIEFPYRCNRYFSFSGGRGRRGGFFHINPVGRGYVDNSDSKSDRYEERNLSNPEDVLDVMGMRSVFDFGKKG